MKTITTTSILKQRLKEREHLLRCFMESEFEDDNKAYLMIKESVEELKFLLLCLKNRETKTIKINIEDLPVNLEIYKEDSLLYKEDICDIKFIFERNKLDFIALKTNNKTLKL